MQHILFYGLAIFALILWGWHHFTVRWIYRSDETPIGNTRNYSQTAVAVEQPGDDDEPSSL